MALLLTGAVGHQAIADVASAAKRERSERDYPRVARGASAERFCSHEINAELSIVMNGQETLGRIRPMREAAFPAQA